MSLEELRRKKTCERIFHSSAWLIDSPTQTGNLLVWEAEGAIFGVDHGGLRHYATYQFDSNGAPLPVIKKIIQYLESDDPWVIAAWFEFPNSWISDGSVAISPKVVLDRDDLVLLAASRRTGSYVA